MDVEEIKEQMDTVELIRKKIDELYDLPDDIYGDIDESVFNAKQFYEEILLELEIDENSIDEPTNFEKKVAFNYENFPRRYVR